MKKVFLTFAIAAGVVFGASAQAKKTSGAIEGAVQKLSIGVEFGLPTGSFNDVYKIGYGGSIQAEFPVAPSLNLTASAGYVSFSPKQVWKDVGLGNFGAIPVKGGAKYYFGGNFYAAGEIGAAFGTQSGSGTAFAYAPTLGTSFAVSDNGAIDLGIRYEGWSKSGSSNFFGIRAAYAFGL